MPDLRYSHTEKLIMEYCRTWVVERGFDAISVSSITKALHLSRGTFYYHFRDKFDLVNRIIEHDLYSVVITEGGHPDSVYLGSNTMLELMKDNQVFYRRVFDVFGYESFFDFFGQLIRRQLLIWIQKRELPPEISIEFVVDFYTGAIQKVIKTWFDGGLATPPREIAEQLHLLIEAQ